MLFAALHCFVGDVVEVSIAMITLLEVKGVAALSLLAGSFLVGLIPSWIGFGAGANSQLEHSLLLSAILCFGAGVLLSTAVVHILGDVVAAIGVWGQIVFCVGFLTLYFVDEAVQFWCLGQLKCEKHQHRTDSESRQEPTESESLVGSGRQTSSSYGSIDRRKSTATTEDERQNLLQKSKAKNDSSGLDFVSSSRGLTRHEPVEDIERIESCENSFPGQDQIESKNRSVKRLGLMFAFCVHSILEGLAIGLQPTTTKVLLLLAAVSCHKLVVTFCLGAELLSTDTSRASYLLSLLLYALTSGLGIAIAMFIQASQSPLIAILQGLAGGSLLYVTVGEILPRERHHKSHCPMPRPTGLLQWLAVVAGFALITFINIYANE